MMSVVQEYRGEGLAQRLLQRVESHCRDERIKSVYFTTQDNLTRAVRFYEKEGYESVCEKKWNSYMLYYYKKDV